MSCPLGKSTCGQLIFLRGIFMRKYALSGILSLIFLFLTVAVHGQGLPRPAPNNNNNAQAPVMTNRPITVREAKDLPHDSWVTLTGNITGVLPGGHNYTFRDPSGDITVDIGPKEWRGLSVDVSDRVEISGEVKIHRGQISIKVHAIRKTGA